MEIKTKFDLGQKVFFLQNNKVNCLQIDCISIRVISLARYNKEIAISYQLNGLTDLFDEENLFATKEELLNSL